jgi:hypothetical protein
MNKKKNIQNKYKTKKFIHFLFFLQVSKHGHKIFNNYLNPYI